MENFSKKSKNEKKHDFFLTKNDGPENGIPKISKKIFNDVIFVDLEIPNRTVSIFDFFRFGS
jgi:hypothetical protein